MQQDEQKVAELVSRVVARLQQKGVAAPVPGAAPSPTPAPEPAVKSPSTGWVRSRPLRSDDRPIQRKGGASRTGVATQPAKKSENAGSPAPTVIKPSVS